MLVNIVNRADVGMIEGGGGLGFALEALQGLMVLGHFFRQELERDEAVELGVLGLVDNTHPTAPKLLNNPVMRDDRADHGFETRNWKLETGNVNVALLQSGPGNGPRTSDQSKIQNRKSKIRRPMPPPNRSRIR